MHSGREERNFPLQIALCRLRFLFVRYSAALRQAQGRDHVIEVREDVRMEKDGPMLIHGLQEMRSTKIVLPRSAQLAPDPKLLEEISHPLT